MGFICRKGIRNCFIGRQWNKKVKKGLIIILLNLKNCTKDTVGCSGASIDRTYKLWCVHQGSICLQKFCCWERTLLLCAGKQTCYQHTVLMPGQLWQLGHTKHIFLKKHPMLLKHSVSPTPAVTWLWPVQDFEQYRRAPSWVQTGDTSSSFLGNLRHILKQFLACDWEDKHLDLNSPSVWPAMAPSGDHL